METSADEILFCVKFILETQQRKKERERERERKIGEDREKGRGETEREMGLWVLVRDGAQRRQR